MNLYTYSPIKSKEELLEAITFTHFACHKLCKQSFGKYLHNSGNMGIFCQYTNEYEFLMNLRKELTEASDNWNQKYYRLLEPIVIPPKNGVPQTEYTYLYIRKPDPYRHQVGDVDFYLEQAEYDRIKNGLLTGTIQMRGVRVFDRPDLDMIELYDPNIDALGYVSTHTMTEMVRVKQSNITKL